MKKGLVFGIIVLIFLVGIYPSSAIDSAKESIEPFNIGNTLYVGGSEPGNYTSIQDAIDNASDFDTIFVYNGTYYENINVYKDKISLIGENKEYTFIDGKRRRDVVKITGFVVSICNFTIRNSGTSFTNFGVDITSSFNTIKDNIIYNNRNGIWLKFPDNNILGNMISSNGKGIELYETHNSIISGNTIISNDGGGIILRRSWGNTIKGNLISLNKWSGIQLDESFDTNEVINNTINSNYGYGIELRWTDDTLISGNTIVSNSKDGININNQGFSRGKSIITRNHISSNNWYGINLFRILF